VSPAAADHLVILQQPSDVTAGQAINPAVQVGFADAFGNAVSDSRDVTVTLSANPGGSMLGGTTTVTPGGGVAVFSDLTLDKAASGYTLTFSASGLTDATSTPFTVSPAAADHLDFTVQPTTTVAGDPITPAVVVEIHDAFDNVVTSDTRNVTLSLS